MGRSELSLEQKLANVSKERDGLAQQILQLQAVRRDMKGRLDKVNDLKTQVDVTHEHIAVLSDAVVSKTEEVDDLKEQIEHLKEELDASRFQVSRFSGWVYLTKVSVASNIYRTRSIVRPPPFFAQSSCRKHFCHDCTPTQRLIY